MEASRSRVPDVVPKPNNQVVQPLDRPIPQAVRAGWYRNMGFISEISLGQLLRLIRRQKWLLILPVLILPVLAFLGASLITPRYTAVTTVMVSSQQMGIPGSERVVGTLPDQAMTVLLNQLEILQSRAIADRVVQQTGLMSMPEFNPTLRPKGALDNLIGPLARSIRALLGRVGIGIPPEEVEGDPDEARLATIRSFQQALDVRLHGVTSGGIAIAFTSENAELAQRVANAVADSYVIDQLQSNFDAVTRASQWLEQRTRELQAAVVAAEQAVEAYRASSGLVTGITSNLAIEQISRLNRELVNAEAALVRAEARLEQIRANGAQASVPEVLRSPVIQQLRGQEARLRSTEAQLSVRMAFGNPRLVEVRSQIANVQRLIGAEVQRIAAASAVAVNEARGRMEAVQNTIAGLRQQINRNNQAEVTLRELQREAENRRNVLHQTLALSNQVSQQANMSGPITRILSRAELPQGPSYPQKKMIVAITILFSFVFGLLLIAIKELLDQTFRSGDEMETVLGLPCLTLIPRMGRHGGTATVYDYVLSNPLSQFAEAIRALRTSLWLQEGQPKSVVIASSRPREGRTMVAVSLARLAAQSGERVLLIDCDIRRPTTQRAFGGSGHKGLFNLLAGETTLEEVIQQDPGSELRYIPAGSLRADSANLMMSEAMTGLVRRLGARFDLIVLVSPPTPALADAQIVARIADAVIYCVRWRSIGRSTVLNGLRMLTASQAKLIGTCLTRVNPRAHARSDFERNHQRTTRGYFPAPARALAGLAGGRGAADRQRRGAPQRSAGMAAEQGRSPVRPSLIERLPLGRPRPPAGPAAGSAGGDGTVAQAAQPRKAVAQPRKAAAQRRSRMIRTAAMLVAAGLIAAGVAMAGALAMRNAAFEQQISRPAVLEAPDPAMATAGPQGAPLPSPAPGASGGTAEPPGAVGPAAAPRASANADERATPSRTGLAAGPGGNWPLPPRRPVAPAGVVVAAAGAAAPPVTTDDDPAAAPPAARDAAPELQVADAAGREGEPIPLHIAATAPDPQAQDSLRVSIAGLPAGTRLSAGTSKGGGRWVLRPTELSGLTLQLPPGLSGVFALTVTAAPELPAGGEPAEPATATRTLTAAVTAVAIPPELRVGDAAGRQGEPIPLDIAVTPADPDGSEGLTVSLAGLPDGAALSVGTDAGEGRWTLRPEELADLTLRLPDSFVGALPVTVTATAWPVGGGDSATTTRSLMVEATAVALPPVLRVGDAAGRAGEPIALEIAVAPADPERREELSVCIEDLPNGAELSAGTAAGRGWTLRPEELDGLTLRLPPQVTGRFALTVAATARAASGDSASTMRTLALEVMPLPPAPRPPADPSALHRLMARGDGLIAVGDVSSARLFYELAAAQGSARAATMIGKTYDPAFLTEQRMHGIAADRAKAMDWYRKGAEAGDRQAADLLQTLTTRLER